MDLYSKQTQRYGTKHRDVQCLYFQFPEVINLSRDVYRVASMLQYQLLLWCFLGRKEYSSLSHRCFSVRPQPASIELHWAHFAKSENRRARGLVSAAELYQTAEVWLANISMGANTDILTLSESPVQLLPNGHRWTSAHLRASASSSSPVGLMLPEAREAEKEESLLQGSSVPQYIYSFHRSLGVLLKMKLPSLSYAHNFWCMSFSSSDSFLLEQRPLYKICTLKTKN